MIMELKDVRDFIGTLGLAEDDNCYMGILPSKKEKSIGTYPLKATSTKPSIGSNDRSYGVKSVSFLVHWNKSLIETEKASNELYLKLKNTKSVIINKHTIKFIIMNQEEPVWVGTDEKGIYEYVIECQIYYEKEDDSE